MNKIKKKNMFNILFRVDLIVIMASVIGMIIDLYITINIELEKLDTIIKVGLFLFCAILFFLSIIGMIIISFLKPEKTIPFENITRYFDNINPIQTPNKVKKGKLFYYIYFWLDKPLQEVGVRMVNNPGHKQQPEHFDIVTTNYIRTDAPKVKGENRCRLVFEKAVSVSSPEDVKKYAASTEWSRFISSDDGYSKSWKKIDKKNTVLLQASNSVGNINQGLYRIGISSKDVNNVDIGNYLLEIGTHKAITPLFISREVETFYNVTTDTETNKEEIKVK